MDKDELIKKLTQIAFSSYEYSETAREAIFLIQKYESELSNYPDEDAKKNDCDFCDGNTEWEDTDNGFFMELRLDPPWHELHINLGYDTPRENDIVIELNYCPKCGRKLADEKR